MKSCKTCAHRWYGHSAHPTFAQWHCRKPGKPLRVIDDMAKATACREWRA